MENVEMKGGEKGGCCHGMACGGCSCGHCGHRKMLWSAVRVLVALVILVGVFCVGFTVGSAVGYSHGSFGSRGSRMMMNSGFDFNDGGMMGNRIYMKGYVNQAPAPVSPSSTGR